ncbi:hypothetical protein [Streptomyces sp. NBC_00078]|uniref:hypothetical protein n=1 Tax=unclassified Streptomyces TaxID=2593676 RepID=UPI0022544392|nr:hypothetical protein [Streptomyces sp. NBC_00078]MCX5423888.1 hypothetical protein [Streptomyces sp. NBC_00078]
MPRWHGSCRRPRPDVHDRGAGRPRAAGHRAREHGRGCRAREHGRRRHPGTDDAVHVTSSGGDQLLGLGADAARLVPGDTNGVSDGFVRHLR